MKSATDLAKMTALYWALSLHDRRRLTVAWPYLKSPHDLRLSLLRLVDDMPVNLCNAVVTWEDRRKRLNRSVGG